MRRDTSEIRNVVWQSRVIHPDWTVEDHINYLAYDGFVISEQEITSPLVRRTVEEALNA